MASASETTERECFTFPEHGPGPPAPARKSFARPRWKLHLLEQQQANIDVLTKPSQPSLPQPPPPAPRSPPPARNETPSSSRAPPTQQTKTISNTTPTTTTSQPQPQSSPVRQTPSRPRPRPARLPRGPKESSVSTTVPTQQTPRSLSVGAQQSHAVQRPAIYATSTRTPEPLAHAQRTANPPPVGAVGVPMPALRVPSVPGRPTPQPFSTRSPSGTPVQNRPAPVAQQLHVPHKLPPSVPHGLPPGAVQINGVYYTLRVSHPGMLVSRPSPMGITYPSIPGHVVTQPQLHSAPVVRPIHGVPRGPVVTAPGSGVIPAQSVAVPGRLVRVLPQPGPNGRTVVVSAQDGHAVVPVPQPPMGSASRPGPASSRAVPAHSQSQGQSQTQGRPRTQSPAQAQTQARRQEPGASASSLPRLQPLPPAPPTDASVSMVVDCVRRGAPIMTSALSISRTGYEASEHNLIKTRKRKRRTSKDIAEKRHACSKCDSTFKLRGDLLRHARVVHEGERKFSCPHCDKVFSHSGHANRHVQAVHRKIRRYKCHLCYDAFSQASHLNSHVKHVHHRIRPWFCNMCTMRFSTETGLRSHLRNSHVDEMFACPEPDCDMNFALASDLSRHCIREHGSTA